VCTDLSVLLSVMWRSGVHLSISSPVCYVEVWCAPIYQFSCLLCGGLVCTDLSVLLSVMWRAGVHRLFINLKQKCTVWKLKSDGSVRRKV
jgi:hypothetical protein